MMRRTIITAICSVAALSSVSAKAAQICAASSKIVSNRRAISYGIGWLNKRLKDACVASIVKSVKSPFTKKSAAKAEPPKES